MPRRQQQYLKQRKLTDERMFFDWTSRNAEVYARPTDPYVRPAVDTEVFSLLEGIKALKTGVEAYTDIQQANIPKNKLRAQAEATADYKANPNAPNPDQKPKGFLNAGWGYDQAYYMSFGEAKGIEFRNELNQALKNNNFFMDSENPDQDKEELYNELWNKYFQGMNEYIMFGANANLKAAILEADAVFAQAKYLKTKETFVNSQGTILTDQAKQYADTDVENPVAMRQVAENLYETNVKDTGLQSKEEYDGLFVDSFGAAALGFASEKIIVDGKTQYKYTTTEAAQKGTKLIQVLKTPDKDGVSLYDVKDEKGNFKYRKAIDAYEDRLIKLIDDREREDEEELKKISEKEHARLFGKLFANRNIEAEIRASYEAGLLTASDYENILLANRQALAGDYDVYQDDLFVNSLENGIYAGTKGRKDITKALGNRQITAATAQRLNGIVDDMERLNRSEKNEQERFYFARLSEESDPSVMLSATDKLDIKNVQQAIATQTNSLRFYNTLIKNGVEPFEAYERVKKQYKLAEGKIFFTSYKTEAEIHFDVKRGKLTKAQGLEQLELLKMQKQWEQENR